MPPSVVLVGSPGAGKSTVGRRVAEQLGVPFADTDALIEAAAGMSVSDIFVTLGEDEFRALEADAVATALEEREGVLSLGGGAVLREETRAPPRGRPRGRGCASRPPTRRAGSGMNTARPLLLGNVRATLSSLLEQRNPVYAEVADRHRRHVGSQPARGDRGGPAGGAR